MFTRSKARPGKKQQDDDTRSIASTRSSSSQHKSSSSSRPSQRRRRTTRSKERIADDPDEDTIAADTTSPVDPASEQEPSEEVSVIDTAPEPTKEGSDTERERPRVDSSSEEESGSDEEEAEDEETTPTPQPKPKGKEVVRPAISPLSPSPTPQPPAVTTKPIVPSVPPMASTSSRNDGGTGGGNADDGGMAPQLFSGDPARTNVFLMQSECFFDFKETWSDSKKVSYAGNRLRGNAQVWYMSAWSQEPKPDDIKTWAAFKRKLKALYPPVDPVTAAKSRLSALRQTGSLLEFIAELDSLCAVTGMLGHTKEMLLRNGAKPHLIAKTTTTGVVYNSYEGLKAALINMDQEEAKNPSHQPSGLRGGGGAPPPRSKKGRWAKIPKSYSGRPKDSAASNDKKKRFDSGACLTCGKMGHYARDCRSGATAKPRTLAVMTNKPTKAPDKVEHSHLHFSGCYKDDCPTHLSDKQGSGWFPGSSKN
jgi:Retrotransposon gag protein/Zinc knuckle